MQAAAQLRQFYNSVFLDYYDPGPPPPPLPPPPPTPSPVFVQTQLAIDPSLSNSLTVLAYVLAFKFALEAFNTAFPFISASLRARSHFMSATRLLVTFLMFTSGIASLVVLLAPFTPAISTLAVFILHGRDGGFSGDTRFLCPYNVDGTILQTSLSFSDALQFLKSQSSCMSEDGSTIVAPMSFLLSHDAPSMLGRIFRLISFAVICTLDRLAQSNIMRCLDSIFQGRMELPPVFRSVTDHFDLELLPVVLIAGLALYITITLTLPAASCLMSGALHIVRVLVSKSVESPRWRDGLMTFPTLVGEIFAARVVAIRCGWSSVIGRVITTSIARKDDVADILFAKNCTLKYRLRSLRNRFNALKECVKDLRKMRTADQSNIRNLQHAADHALRQRDDARMEANIATLKADTLEAHILELEATIKRLQDEAAGWTQLERDILAINTSPFAIQPTDVIPSEIDDEADVFASQNTKLEETVDCTERQTMEAAEWAQFERDYFVVDMPPIATVQPTKANITVNETHAPVSQDSELKTAANYLQEQMEEAMKWEQFNGDVFAVAVSTTAIQSADVPSTETNADNYGDDALITQNLELEKAVKGAQEQTDDAAEWVQFERDVFAVDTSGAATILAETLVNVQEADTLVHDAELEATATPLQEQAEQAAEQAQIDWDVFAVDIAASATQPAKTNVAAHKTDALAAQNIEFEETVNFLQKQAEKAVESVQSDTDASAVDVTVTATEQTCVALPSVSPPHIHDAVPSIIFTNADSETEALSTCRVTAASLGTATLAGTNAKTGSTSRLPRRALADITTDATKNAVKGKFKSHFKQAAHKTHVEKENLRFGYRGA